MGTTFIICLAVVISVGLICDTITDTVKVRNRLKEEERKNGNDSEV